MINKVKNDPSLIKFTSLLPEISIGQKSVCFTSSFGLKFVHLNIRMFDGIFSVFYFKVIERAMNNCSINEFIQKY